MIINSNQLEGSELLVICPTRERPKKLARMYESFLKTTNEKTVMILCIDAEDQTEYSNYYCPISIEPHKTNTQIINDIFNKYPNFKYYSVTNDDFVYHTPDWDTMLMSEGVNFGEDSTKREFPVTSVIDGDLVRAIGWLQCPRVDYLFGDTVWDVLAEQAKCKYYFPDVLIEHRHFLFGTSELDETYKRTNAKAQFDKDRQGFADWLRLDFQNDLKKVQKLYEKIGQIR